MSLARGPIVDQPLLTWTFGRLTDTTTFVERREPFVYEFQFRMMSQHEIVEPWGVMALPFCGIATRAL